MSADDSNDCDSILSPLVGDSSPGYTKKLTMTQSLKMQPDSIKDTSNNQSFFNVQSA